MAGLAKTGIILFIKTPVYFVQKPFLIKHLDWGCSAVNQVFTYLQVAVIPVVCKTSVPAVILNHEVCLTISVIHVCCRKRPRGWTAQESCHILVKPTK